MVTWPVFPLTTISRVFSTKLYHLRLSEDTLKQYRVEYFKWSAVQDVLLKAAFTPAAVRRVEYRRTCLPCSFIMGSCVLRITEASALTSSFLSVPCFPYFPDFQSGNNLLLLRWCNGRASLRTQGTFSVPPGRVRSASWVARSVRIQ